MPIDTTALINGLVTNGWYVQHDTFAAVDIKGWQEDLHCLQAGGQLASAGIGRGETRQLNAGIRGDSTYWFDAAHATAAQQYYLQVMETLRHAIQGELFLGVTDSEFHYAAYPPLARYARHLDRHQATDARLVTVITYLNDNWLETDGGALRLYLDDKNSTDIFPAAGTLVCFLSDRFWHEVLPAQRERLSISGWLRRGEMFLG